MKIFHITKAAFQGCRVLLNDAVMRQFTLKFTTTYKAFAIWQSKRITHYTDRGKVLIPSLPVIPRSAVHELSFTLEGLSSTYRQPCNVKPRPNDRNMPTQHVATLLSATCCVRLATVLRYVATCWLLLAQV